MNNQTLEDKLLQKADWFAESYYPEHEYGGSYREHNTELRVGFVKEIMRVLEDEGYTKKHQILYGTKYPDPRPCTKNSHFVEDGKDCGCGYTATMRKTDDTNNL